MLGVWRYFFGTRVLVFGTVTGATTQGVVADAPVVPAAALLVDVALLVWIGEVPGVADVAEAGTFAEAEVLVVPDADGVIPVGQGFTALFVVVVVVVLGVAVAPAGTLLLGLVVDVADPGVAPGFVVFIVPFCWVVEVVEVALPGVVFCAGVMPGVG